MTDVGPVPELPDQGGMFVPVDGAVLVDTIASNAILAVDLPGGGATNPGVVLRLAGRINNTDDRSQSDFILSKEGLDALLGRLIQHHQTLEQNGI